MVDRFSGQPRGRTLPGARRIAEHIWNTPECWRSVYLLDRVEFGLIDLNGKITGFSNWIDLALAARAQAGKRRPRRAGTSTTTEANAQT